MVSEYKNLENEIGFLEKTLSDIQNFKQKRVPWHYVLYQVGKNTPKGIVFKEIRCEGVNPEENTYIFIIKGTQRMRKRCLNI